MPFTAVNDEVTIAIKPLFLNAIDALLDQLATTVCARRDFGAHRIARLLPDGCGRTANLCACWKSQRKKGKGKSNLFHAIHLSTKQAKGAP